MSQNKRDVHVEVNGRLLFAFVDGVPDAFERAAFRALEQHGIEDPDPSDWYPQADLVNTLEYVETNVGTATLKLIGQAIAKETDWPDDIDSVSEALEAVDDAHDQNHRGDAGEYRVEHVNPRTIKVETCTPYPCVLEEAMFKRVATEFADGIVDVSEVGDECRSDGAGCCVYRIEA